MPIAEIVTAPKIVHLSILSLEFGIVLNIETKISTIGKKENRKIILRIVHAGTGVKKSDKSVHIINALSMPNVHPRGIKNFLCQRLYTKNRAIVKIIKTRIIAISKPSKGLKAN